MTRAARTLIITESGGDTVYPVLLDDQATDQVAAGAVNGTYTTGTNPLIKSLRGAVDTGSKLSIHDGLYDFAAYTTQGDDPRVYVADQNGDAFVRSQGLVFAFDLYLSSVADAFMIGWVTGTGAGIARWLHTLYVSSGTGTICWWNNPTGTYYLSTDLTTNSLRKFAIVLQSTGAVLLKASADLQTWKLLYIDEVGTTSPLYVGFANRVGGGSHQRVDNLKVRQAGSTWQTINGFASTSLTGSRSAGDTFTHHANSCFKFTLTTRPSAGQTEFWFRSSTVGTDGLRVTITSTGAITLDRVESGVSTTIASGTGVASGAKIFIRADGQNVGVWSNGVNKINATGVSQFETSTIAELEALGTGGAVSDIYAFNVVLTGTVATQINTAVF